MILSVGIDIVEVSRIRTAMKNPRFIERILTPRERATSSTVQFVAGRWAVKEAIAKAVGTELTWQAVEVLNDHDGRPTASVSSATFSEEVHRIHVSISHERGHAVGLAVLESI